MNNYSLSIAIPTFNEEKHIKECINAIGNDFADFIYVIDKGNILEKGTYSNLKSKKDSFFNYLISSQKL